MADVNVNKVTSNHMYITKLKTESFICTSLLETENQKVIYLSAQCQKLIH